MLANQTGHDRGAAESSPAQPLRAQVMISGLASVSGCPVQSPNCSSIVRPASGRKEDSVAASRKRGMPRFTSERSHPGLV
jgi:hypothetical protein